MSDWTKIPNHAGCEIAVRKPCAGNILVQSGNQYLWINTRAAAQQLAAVLLELAPSLPSTVSGEKP